MVYAGALQRELSPASTSSSSDHAISSHAWAYVAMALAGTLGYLVGAIVGWAIGL